MRPATHINSIAARNGVLTLYGYGIDIRVDRGHLLIKDGIAANRRLGRFPRVVHNNEQVAVAFSGLAEDTGAYKGSKDWTRYYAVVYQAEPFMLESHLRSDMKRIGAATWTPIVVNGPTKKKPGRRTKKKTKPQ